MKACTAMGMPYRGGRRENEQPALWGGGVLTLALLTHSFTGVGYPKETPLALAKHVEENNLQGQLRFSLFVGASTGPEVEERASSFLCG